MDRTKRRLTTHPTGTFRSRFGESPIPARAQVVLVDDATQPLGRAIALALADAGQVVLAVGPSPASLTDLPRETMQGGVIDIATPAPGARAQAALNLFGRLNAAVIVAEASPAHLFRPIDQVPTLWDPTFASRLNAAQELALALSAQGDGRLLLVNALPSLPLAPQAAIARAAWNAATLALRTELLAAGVTVLGIQSDLVQSQPSELTLESCLDRVATALPPDAPTRPLLGPLRTLLTATVPEATVAAAAVRALLAPRPRLDTWVQSTRRPPRPVRLAQRTLSKLIRR